MSKGTFISFGDVSSASTYEESGGNHSRGKGRVGVTSITSPVYTGSDPSLVQISKKLLKKDGITRRKSLQEVQDIINRSADVPASSNMVIEFIPHFCYVYERLWSDNDRSIREGAQLLLQSIIKAISTSDDKQALGPYMRILIGPWRLSCLDLCSEVSAAAKVAWELAIPGIKRRLKVLMYLSPCYIRFVNRILTSSNLDVIPDAPGAASMTTDETQDRIERVTLCAIGSIEDLFGDLSGADLLHLAVTGATVPASLATANLEVGSVVFLKEVLGDAVLWSKTSSPAFTPAILRLFTGMSNKIQCIFSATTAAAAAPGSGADASDAKKVSSDAVSISDYTPDAFLDACGCTMSSLYPKLVATSRSLVEGPQKLNSMCSLALNTILAANNTFSNCWQHFSILPTGGKKKGFLEVLNLWLSVYPDVAFEYLLPLVASFPVSSVSVLSCTSDGDGEWSWKVGEKIVEILDNKLATVQQRHGACAISVAETLTYMMLKRASAACEPSEASRRGQLCVNTLVKALEYTFVRADVINPITGTPPPTTLRHSLERILVQLHRTSVTRNADSAELHAVYAKSWAEVLWPKIGSSLVDALITKSFYSDLSSIQRNEIVLSHVLHVLKGVKAAVAAPVAQASESVFKTAESEGIFVTSNVLFSAVLQHISDTDANTELTEPQWQQLQVRGLKLLCRLHQDGLAGSSAALASLFRCVSRIPPTSSTVGVTGRRSGVLEAALAENDPVLLKDTFLMMAALAQEATVAEECDVPSSISGIMSLCVLRSSAMAACIALQCGLCSGGEGGGSEDVTASAETSLRTLLALRPVVLSVVCVVAATESVMQGKGHHRIVALGEYVLECAASDTESSSEIYMSALLSSVKAIRGASVATTGAKSQNNYMSRFISDCQMLLIADQEKVLTQTLLDLEQGGAVKVPQLFEKSTIDYLLKLVDTKAKAATPVRTSSATSSGAKEYERYRSAMRRSIQQLTIPCVPSVFTSWGDAISLGRYLVPSAMAQLAKTYTASCSKQVDEEEFTEASMELFVERANSLIGIPGYGKDAEKQQMMNNIIEWSTEHGQVGALPAQYDLFTQGGGAANLKKPHLFEILAKLVKKDQKWLVSYLDVASFSKVRAAFSFLCELHQGCTEFPQLKVFAHLRAKTSEALRCAQVGSDGASPALELWKCCENMLISETLTLKDILNSTSWFCDTVSDVLNCILQHEREVWEQPCLRTNFRIDTPMVSDIIPVGTTVYYIEQQQTSEEGIVDMRTVEAIMQKSHLADIPAYYTLEIGGNREVQTEAHRVLLEKPRSESSAQAYRFGCPMSAPMEIDSSGNGNICTRDASLQHVMKWLMNSCKKVINLSQTGTKAPVAEYGEVFMSVLCDALIQLGRSMDQSRGLNAMSEHAESVFGAYRQAAVKLLDSNLSDDVHADTNIIANRIIQALAESNSGRGSGLWLPKVLHFLVGQIKSRQGKEEITATTFWTKMKEKITKGRKFDFIADGKDGKTAELEAEKSFVRDVFERNSKYLQSIGNLFCTLMASVAAGSGDCHDIYTATHRAAVSKPSSPREGKRELSFTGESSASAESLVTIYPWRALLQASKTYFLNIVLGSSAEDVITSPGLTAACIKCLRLYWATNSVRPSIRNRSVGAELLPERWEVQAFRLCLEIFTKRVLWFPTQNIPDMQEQLCKSAAMALHYGLLHASLARSAAFLKEFLGHSMKDETTALLRRIAIFVPCTTATSEEVDDVESARELTNTICSGMSVLSYVTTSNAGDELLDPSCPSFHIIAGKVLDAWYRSGGEPVAISMSHHKYDDAAGEEDEEEAAVHLELSGLGYGAFTEQEKAEKQRLKDAADLDKDLKLFEEVVGAEFAEKLAALVQELTDNNENHRPTSYESARSIVLLFLLILQRVDQAALQRQEDRGFLIRARCGAYLREVQILPKCALLLLGLAEGLLGSPGNAANAALPKNVENIFQWCMPAQFNAVDASNASPEASHEEEEKIDEETENGTHLHESLGKHLEYLALLGLFRMTVVLPAITRSWYNNDLSRSQKVLFGRFVETTVRPASIERELELIREGQAAGRWNTDELEVRGHRSNGGEVAATFLRDDAKVEVKIRIPATYPLKNVEVDCITRLGVPEAKWRRWSFQIIQLLSMQDGTIIDGVLLWKKNLENEFDGVEPCPICYSTLHHKSMSLPSMACPTCDNKFHPLCLNTWFKQSGKYKCVLCQQPFFQG